MNVKICTETFESNKPASLATYLKYGGYEAWKKNKCSHERRL